MNRVPLVLLLAWTLAACGDATSGACEPGDSIACTCDDGRSGTASCGAPACDCAVALVLEPASLDFGEVPRGESREAVFLVRNRSRRDVRLRSAGFPGDATRAFSLPDGVPTAVPAGETVTLAVRFTPVLPGSIAARLRLEPDEPGAEPVEAEVSGRVAGPRLVCDPSPLEFSAWTRVPVTVTLACTNVGFAIPGEDARIRPNLLVTRGEGFSAEWKAGHAPPTGIAPRITVWIDVRFEAPAAGEHRGTLVVAGHDFDVEVPLVGRAENPPTCQLEVQPDRVDVSAEEFVPGTRNTFEISIRNRREDAPCVLEHLRLCSGSDRAFWLQGAPLDRVVLPGGAVAQVPVGFDPRYNSCQQPGDGCVEFDLVPTGHGSFPLSCSAPEYPPALAIPAAVDFGTHDSGCHSLLREVELANTTLDTLHVNEAAFVQGPGGEFSFRSGLDAGTPIEPGGKVRFVVAFSIPEPGERTGELAVRFRELAEPVRIPLRGAGDELWLRDSFTQNDRPKLDLLVVVDNGTSMVEEAARLVPELGGLPAALQAQDLDFRLAVTTTGLVAGDPGCPGGANGGEDGRFVPVDGSRPRILDEHTPDLQATWEANLAVGACHGAPPQTIEAAVRALTEPLSTSADDPRHPEPNDGNLGFLRSDALLTVLAISDRADASPETVSHYHNALQALKGFRNTHLLTVHAIAGDRNTGCTGANGREAGPGDRLFELADQTEGGTVQSICGDGWMTNLDLQVPFGPRRCFYLRERPRDIDRNGVISDADGELRVFVDGAEVSSTTGDGRPVWSYSLDEGAVCFAYGHLPAYGAAIAIDYRLACY